MNRRDALLAYFLIAGALVLSVISRAADDHKGDWTIHHSDEQGKVEFSLIEHHHGGNSNHQSDWPLSVFIGLDYSQAGHHEVKFTITRDAGRFDCAGFLENGEGAGLFHFLPDAKFVGEMKSLGFGGIDDEKQFAMAIFDVSLDFAKVMKEQHLEGLDADKLIAFRIFNVTPEFIKQMRSAGLTSLNCGQAHRLPHPRRNAGDGERPAQDGYQPDEDTLIAMRIHGATPEWIAQLQKEGYDHVDLQELIAFRIHGVSPEFIEKIQSLGYKHPEPNQLVAMRIHGVTPEFISSMKSHGMQNLTIDQLVSLRIQGIN